MTLSLHPYLFFSGTAREAMTRYQTILGGELEILGLDGMPPEVGDEMPPGLSPDFVMHAALTLPDGVVLYGSDDPTGTGAGTTGISVNITLDDQADARRIFDALADGGEVGMALEPTFWSPMFGTLTDRFGVAWMVDVEADA